MKRTLLALMFCLVAFQSSFAEMDIEFVSKERAKTLGMEMRLKGSGPDEAFVELEFRTVGDLENFLQVNLEIREGNKLLIGYAPLQKQASTDGRVLVGFMANRAYLEKVSFCVVTGTIGNRAGHQLRVKDFVNLN